MLGARMHYAVPRLLYEAGLLERFYTDSYIGNKPWLEAALKAIPSRLQSRGIQRWLGRRDLVLPPNKIESFEVLGLWYVWARSRVQVYAQRERVHATAAQRFNRRIIATGLDEPNVLWGFNGAALELFQAFKGTKTRCILEQTILPKRQEIVLLNDEIKRWPGWEPGLEAPPETNSLLGSREEQEWALADCIVTGSEFVRTGLIECGVPESKIRVVPYGVDISCFSAGSPGPRSSGTDPLRILFAGIVGLRKGVPDLLRALQCFKPGDVEVRIAGSIMLDVSKLKLAGNEVQFLGRVPRSEMRELFRWADVFVLPSLVEGSATVTYEALMAGVPIITTPNAGSLVQDGVDGFIVPIRSPNLLADAIARYQKDRFLLARHQTATAQSCKQAELGRYGNDLVRLIQDLSQDKFYTKLAVSCVVS